MENLWDPIENLWKTYAKPMENLWNHLPRTLWKTYGKPMENLWKTYLTVTPKKLENLGEIKVSRRDELSGCQA